MTGHACRTGTTGRSTRSQGASSSRAPSLTRSRRRQATGRRSGSAGTSGRCCRKSCGTTSSLASRPRCRASSTRSTTRSLRRPLARGGCPRLRSHRLLPTKASLVRPPRLHHLRQRERSLLRSGARTGDRWIGRVRVARSLSRRVRRAHRCMRARATRRGPWGASGPPQPGAAAPRSASGSGWHSMPGR